MCTATNWPGRESGAPELDPPGSLWRGLTRRWASGQLPQGATARGSGGADGPRWHCPPQFLMEGAPAAPAGSIVSGAERYQRYGASTAVPGLTAVHRDTDRYCALLPLPTNLQPLQHLCAVQIMPPIVIAISSAAATSQPLLVAAVPKHTHLQALFERVQRTPSQFGAQLR